MFHRHPFLSLATFGYLGFVALVTLSPQRGTPSWQPRVEHVLARLHAHDLVLWLTYSRVEFLANIGLFVPVGLFLLLLFGSRLWWVAVGAGFVLTSAIETAQRSIPGRVSDPRDILSNTLGAALGVALGLVLTLPGTLRRRRARLARREAQRTWAG